MALYVSQNKYHNFTWKVSWFFKKCTPFTLCHPTVYWDIFKFQNFSAGPDGSFKHFMIQFSRMPIWLATIDNNRTKSFLYV